MSKLYALTFPIKLSNAEISLEDDELVLKINDFLYAGDKEFRSDDLSKLISQYVKYREQSNRKTYYLESLSEFDTIKTTLNWNGVDYISGKLYRCPNCKAIFKALAHEFKCQHCHKETALEDCEYVGKVIQTGSGMLQGNKVYVFLEG